MSFIVRKSTAVSLTIGPVMDATGAFVADSIVGDFKISKNGATPASLNGSAALTYIANGLYTLALTTSDTGTVGTASIVCEDGNNACPTERLQIIEQPVYDALFAASGTGKLPATIAAGDVAANAVDAASLKADAITKIQTGLMTAGGYTAPDNAGISSAASSAAAAASSASAINTKLGTPAHTTIAGDIANVITHGDSAWEGGGGGGSGGGGAGDRGVVPGTDEPIFFELTDATGEAITAPDDNLVVALYENGNETPVASSDDDDTILALNTSFAGVDGACCCIVTTDDLSTGKKYTLKATAGSVDSMNLNGKTFGEFWTARTIGQAVWEDYIVAVGLSAGSMLKKIAEYCFGKSSGATNGSGTIVIRNLEDNADSITIQANSNGNRTNVNLH